MNRETTQKRISLRQHMRKKRYRVLLGLCIFLWACQSVSEKSTGQATLDGKVLYKTNCVTCHGLQGDMGAAGAANLRQSKLSLEERVVVITKGRNAMQAYEEQLSAQQIQAVANYTLQLQDAIN